MGHFSQGQTAGKIRGSVRQQPGPLRRLLRRCIAEQSGGHIVRKDCTLVNAQIPVADTFYSRIVITHHFPVDRHRIPGQRNIHSLLPEVPDQSLKISLAAYGAGEFQLIRSGKTLPALLPSDETGIDVGNPFCQHLVQNLLHILRSGHLHLGISHNAALGVRHDEIQPDGNVSPVWLRQGQLPRIQEEFPVHPCHTGVVRGRCSVAAVSKQKSVGDVDIILVNLIHLLEKPAALLVVQLVIVDIQLKSGISPGISGRLGAVGVHDDIHVLRALICPGRKGHLPVPVGNAEHRHHRILHRHVVIIGKAVVGLRGKVFAVHVPLIGVEYRGVIHKPDQASAAVRHQHITRHPVAVLLFPLQRLRVHHIHAPAAGSQEGGDVNGCQAVQPAARHLPAGDEIVDALLPQGDVYLHLHLRLPKPDIQTILSLLHLTQRGFHILLGGGGNIFDLVAVIVLQRNQGICDSHIGAVQVVRIAFRRLQDLLRGGSRPLQRLYRILHIPGKRQIRAGLDAVPGLLIHNGKDVPVLPPVIFYGSGLLQQLILRIFRRLVFRPFRRCFGVPVGGHISLGAGRDKSQSENRYQAQGNPFVSLLSVKKHSGSSPFRRKQGRCTGCST